MFRAGILRATALGILSLLVAGNARAEVLAIRGAHLLTADGDVSPSEIARGTLVIRDGKIVAVGDVAAVEIPPGAKIVEADGLWITPGIIDAHSHMGAAGWPNSPANEDINEMTNPISAQVRVLDSVNFQDPALLRAVAGGVTTIQVLPGSGNMVGGQSAILKLRHVGGRYADLFTQAPPGLKMASGENPKRVYGGKGQEPSTRMGNFSVLRTALYEAQAYREKWAKWETGDHQSPAPARDLKMETLGEVLAGKRLVHIHCYRQDEMLTFIQISHEFGFKIRSFEHGLEAYKIAPVLAREGIAVNTWAYSYGFKLEAKDGIPYNPAILAQAGAMFTMHSDSADSVQRLWHEAAQLTGYGVSEQLAVKSFSANPAWVLGVQDRTGRLAAGLDADLAVFDRHPFAPYARVEKTYIDGQLVYDRRRDWVNWNHLPPAGKE